MFELILGECKLDPDPVWKILIAGFESGQQFLKLFLLVYTSLHNQGRNADPDLDPVINLQMHQQKVRSQLDPDPQPCFF